jgi:hypothetical protein
MYSTCLFCNKPLGANEALEGFPVGRRLAFDGAKGRLWVVCRSCERWNLSPLEERWEVIEACERLYRDTRLRLATENIGLARLPQGLELVRIGEPLRPEFAAWRYGDQFGRRRRRFLLIAGAAIGGMALLNIGGAVAGVTIGGFGGVFGPIIGRVINGDPNEIIARFPVQGRRLEVKRRQLKRVRLLEDGNGFSLQIPVKRDATVLATGEEARLAAALLLPPINRAGASRKQVAGAVELLDRSGDPARVAADAARFARVSRAQSVRALPREMRLALEMASHEEAERRALEGELKTLEEEWRRAEELAAISDQLLMPPGIEQKLQQMRRDG